MNDLSKNGKILFLITFAILCILQTAIIFLLAMKNWEVSQESRNLAYNSHLALLPSKLIIACIISLFALLAWHPLICVILELCNLIFDLNIEMEPVGRDVFYHLKGKTGELITAFLMFSTIISSCSGLGIYSFFFYESNEAQEKRTQKKEDIPAIYFPIKSSSLPEYEVLTEDAKIFALSLKDKQVKIYGDTAEIQAHIKRFSLELEIIKHYIQQNIIDQDVLRRRLKNAGFIKVIEYRTRSSSELLQRRDVIILD